MRGAFGGAVVAEAGREINAFLQSVLVGAVERQFHRVRAIFIGHGGAGKTSLIRALHGEDVVKRSEEMTLGHRQYDSRGCPCVHARDVDA
jgi:hypothetical protein